MYSIYGIAESDAIVAAAAREMRLKHPAAAKMKLAFPLPLLGRADDVID
jgi:hypothetical protein